MKFAKLSGCALAASLALTSAPAWATVDEYKDGDTKLTAVQDKFAIEVHGVNDAGNSVRVYIRPRNGNCVTANNSKVTWSGFTALDGMPMYQGGVTDVDWNLTLHDNPMCEDSKWGWYSIDDLKYVYKTGTYKTVIHGTLKSYQIEITVVENYNNSGKTVVTKLRTS